MTPDGKTLAPYFFHDTGSFVTPVWISRCLDISSMFPDLSRPVAPHPGEMTTVQYTSTVTATSGDKALLTNYNSITVSPELGLTSANRSMQYGNVKMSIPSNCGLCAYYCTTSRRYCCESVYVVINQVSVSRRASLRKSWHGLLFAAIRAPDVMNS